MKSMRRDKKADARPVDRRRRQDWRRLEARWVKRFKSFEPVRQHALLELLQASLPTAAATRCP